MGPRPARNAAGASGNRRDGAPAVPAAGSRAWAGMFVLTAAAGLALAFAVVTGTPAAPATAAVTARTATTVDTPPEFEPCPCDKPICRPGCSQSMASGGPASMIQRQTHAAAECTDPKCISGTPPAAAPPPGSQLTGRTGHRRPPARAARGLNTAASAAPAHAGTSTVSASQINCPPPNPEATAGTGGISDC